MTYIAQFLQYSNDLPLADDDIEVRPYTCPSQNYAFVHLSLFHSSFFLSFKPPSFYYWLFLFSVSPSWSDAASNSAFSYMLLSCQPPYTLHSCSSGLSTAPGTDVMECLSSFPPKISFHNQPLLVSECFLI